MASFNKWLYGSAASQKQDAKFDARQYEFFSGNVEEYELGGLNAGSERAPISKAGNEESLSIGKQKLNPISKPKRTEKGYSSKQTILKYVPKLPKINQRHSGKIKWYDNQRGFGFIIPEAGGPELYVHCSYLKSDGIIHLAPGTRVEYESIGSFNGKMQAINVTGPNNRLLQDCRKTALPDLSTLVKTTNAVGPSQSCSSNPGVLGPCFDCGKWGHISKDCPVAAKRGQQRAGENSGLFGFGEGWNLMWCYVCQNVGHSPTSCPWGQARS